MQIRHYLSAISVLVVLACSAYSNETVLYGSTLSGSNAKPCGNQNGEEGDGGEDNSDPIDLSTGGYQNRATDLVIPGRGIDFEIKRMYRSYGGLQARIFGGVDPLADPDPNPVPIIGNRNLIHALTEAPLGDHWDFNYNMRVSFTPPVFEPFLTDPSPHSPDPILPDEHLPSGIDVMTGEGRIELFSKYTPPNGIFASGNPALYSNDHFRLRVSFTYADEYVYITDSALTRYEFFASYNTAHTGAGSTTTINPYAGRLKSITDRNGNQISFTWETSTNGVERIDYAIDTLNHTIDFIYHDEQFNNAYSLQAADPNFDITNREQLIWVIQDHAGRAYQYNYVIDKGFPMLASVTTPEIKNTTDFPLPAEHERFQSGRTWRYTYDNSIDLGNWWSGRMLKTVKSPNGYVITKNWYEYIDGHLGRFDSNDDRVKRQQYGNAYYNYIVTKIDGSIDLPIAGETNYDYYVWVNDRRGAITRFKYAGSDSLLGFHRQLLEKVEFAGFDPNPDHQVWAEETSPGVFNWRVLAPNSTVDDNNWISYSGPMMADGVTPATEIYVRTWETNSNWDMTLVTEPNGDRRQSDRWGANPGPGSGSLTDDPLMWGAVEKLTITSDDSSESISQEWRYDFTASGGGGCGCGSVGFETAHKDGKGYVTIKHFDPANGNLLAEYHDMPIGTSMTTTGAQAASMGTAAAVDSYTYNLHGQVLTHTHPSKKILNAQGIEVNHPRIDQYEYYSNVVDVNNYGRLHKMHIDVSGFDLATAYEYDAVGNVIKEISPDENIVNFIYNQDAQLVQEQHFNSTETELFAQKDMFYDANANLVREEALNLDGNQNPVVGNSTITSVFVYDIHNYLVTRSRESGVFDSTIAEVFGGDGTGRYIAPETDDNFVTQKWQYDGAKNLVKFSDGEAVNGIAGNQTDNVVTYVYDARDLPTKSTSGTGSTTPLITSYEYDNNGRQLFTRVDPENQTGTQVTQFVYDSFNRIVERIDPMENQYLYKYDDNHNPLELRVCGPVGLDTATGSDNQYLLAMVSRSYGVLDLMDSESIKMYNYDYSEGSESGPICEELANILNEQTISYSYNKDSSIYEINAPSGDSLVDDVTTIHYDTASRLASKMDGAGNITQYQYDADSNVSKVIQSDISSTGSTTEEFVVEYEYDALNRQIAMIDGVGNLTVTWYDSRSNVVKVEDALNSISTYTYDSLSRLTDTSLGNGLVSSMKVYDNSNRLVSEMDANGNSTLYEFDDLNRVTKITMPDGQFYTAAYNFNGNVATNTDPRGVVMTQYFDKNNRLNQRNITGTAVPGTTEEHFSYDGLGRLRKASNDFAEITREYDSRMNVIREIQNVDAANGFPTTSDQVVAYEFDTANNNSKIVYPDNIRSVYRTHDELNRLVGIFNDATFLDPISEFGYIGTRLKSRTNGNQTQTGYNYSGYTGGLVEIGDFGFVRVNKITTTNTSTTDILDAFTFTWDKNQNKISYKDTQSGMKNRRQRTFGYDSANRLTSTDVDYPDPLTDYTAPANNGITTYTLDGVHNRTDVSGYERNGAPLGPYSQSGNQTLNNQYTFAPREGGGSWTYLYDENGNMVLKAEYNVADFTGNYVLDFFDLSAFTTAHGNQDASADLNDDGIWDFLDVSIFLGVYVNGATLDNVHYSYDFRNQLVGIEFKNGITVSYTVTNTYDPMARRVVEKITEGVNVESKQMVYGGESLWEVLEQIDSSTDDVLLTHVYGFGIDDEVSYRIENQTTPEDIWTHRDDLNSLTSISKDNGDILERYEYGDYGKVSFFNAAGLSIPAPAYNAQHLYTGRSLITGTGLYDYRFRVMDPETGRFVHKDPLGFVDSMNLYSYGIVSPYSGGDPYGLDWIDFIPIISTYSHGKNLKYKVGTHIGDYLGLGGLVTAKKCKRCQNNDDVWWLENQCMMKLNAMLRSWGVRGLSGFGTDAMKLLVVEVGAAVLIKGGGKLITGTVLGGVGIIDSLVDASIILEGNNRAKATAKAAAAKYCSCATAK